MDELDKAVEGRLEAALRRHAKEDDDEFERLWANAGTNLRAGRARMVVALDDSSADLERIFRFLATNSELDVQLLTVQRYSSTLGEVEVVVPQMRVNSLIESNAGRRPGMSEPPKELLAVVDAYNKIAQPGAQAVGTASSYRMVRPEGVHYAFKIGRSYIRVQVRHQ